MSAIIFSALLYYVMFLFVMAMFRPIKAQALTFSFLYLMFLLVLAVLNFEFDLVEQKFASTFSYERFRGIETRFNVNFLFQGWVNSLAFVLTRSWEAAIGVNIAIFAALFLMVDRIRWVYVGIFLAPGVIHISVFALRDVVMAATMFFFCVFVLPKARPNLVLVAFFLFAFYLQRVEFIIVVVLAYGLFYYREFNTVQKVLVGSICFAAFVFLLPQAPRALGLPAASSIFAVPDTLLTFSQLRADRWTGTDGADTAILDGALTSVPFIPKFILQIVLFFISPFPTDFKGVSSAVILIDSLIFCAVFVKFYKVADRRHIYLFFVYVISNAFFVANYGNLFRVRMPSYFIMLSGFLTYYGALAAQQRAAFNEKRSAATANET